jgi:shikimate dehydrogenase
VKPAEVSARGHRETRVLGVVGAYVGHSLSPSMHARAFAHLAMDAVYLPFDVPVGAFARALAGAQALGLWGLNVTAPHKEIAYTLATEATPAAHRARAANVLRLDAGGHVVADSTDGQAVIDALRARDERWAAATSVCAPALVLGAGGVARACAVALAEAGATVAISARRPEAAAALADGVGHLGGQALAVPWPERLTWAARSPLVVQSTPLGGGVRPRGDPLGGEVLPGGRLVELAYGPEATPLERRARVAGRDVVDGREILARQGALSWRLWFGIDGPLEVMRRAIAPAQGA